MKDNPVVEKTACTSYGAELRAPALHTESPNPQHLHMSRAAAGITGAHVLQHHRHPVQHKGNVPSRQAETIHRTAQHGLTGPYKALPYLNTIQHAFGAHDVSNVRAHVGGPAREANAAMGSVAYASGTDAVAFKSTPDLHTAAHEAAHIVQHRAGVSLTDGVGAVGSMYEQHADAVADRVVQGQSAEKLLNTFSTTHATSTAPIQHKIVMGGKIATVATDTKNISTDISSDLAKKSSIKEYKATVLDMSKDSKTRYFKDIQELNKYISEKTYNIGYVDREKTWVRLPDKALLLGESHGGTVLTDLANATGATYQYESEQAESPYLSDNDKLPAGPGSSEPKSIEASLPKYIVGLNAFRDKIAKEVRSARSSIEGIGPSGGIPKKTWKKRVNNSAKNQRNEFNPNEIKEQNEKYQKQLTEWSTDWDNKHKTPKSRNKAHIEETKGFQPSIKDKAPERPYRRDSTEARIALQALQAVARMHKGAGGTGCLSGSPKDLWGFYQNHKSIFTKTIEEMSHGVDMASTTIFKKMVTGKFDMDVFIQLMTEAAKSEAEKANITQVDEKTQGYLEHREKNERDKDAERLRDSYMIDSIKRGIAKGVRLFGVGDNHRKNIEGVLSAQKVDIECKPSGTFYVEQHKKHPDQ